ncbi:RNA-directed DNA polymerase, eukaryota [Tanacetum coccineum]
MVTNFQSKKDNVGDTKNSFASVLKAGSYKPVTPSDSSPAIVLDESYVSEKDLSCSLMGKIKDINALPNLYVILANEGFDNVNLTYLGGYWVLIDDEGLPIKSWNNVAFAKTVSPWGTLANVDVEDDTSLPFKKLCVEIDHVSESSCMNDHGVDIEKQDSGNEQKIISEDPFGIYELLNKNKDKEDSKDEDPTFPHGFTPKVINDTVGLGQSTKKNWIRELNRKFKVNFVAIQETKLENIDYFSIKALLGNFAYDFVVSPSMGYSGGLLCVWDPNMFSKESVTIFDSFLAIRDLSKKKSLWDYISHMIDLWEGENIILGDFNEVRSKHERFGTTFNDAGANAFNHFISSVGLIDLPLEGYSYTWALKSASKMSKLDRFLISDGLLSAFPSLSALCLDRHLSDHRPILMRELSVDYGPSPFHVFHSWFSKDEFDKLVEDSWKNLACEDSNSISLLKKKFQALKASIKAWCKEDNQRKGNEGLVIERTSLLKDLQDINARYSLDLAQKAKIRWSIKGDENSNHSGPKISLDPQMFKQLSDEQKENLEYTVTYEEIKKAIWDCGTNKSPRPGGFTFDFIRRYWKIMDQDVANAVREFFILSKFPPGSNSSFITLIPKKQDAKVVKDFRPITLIGCIYKIIAKIKANRLSLVISNLISDVQSAFVANRQILNGPFILNKLLSWFKYHKTKAMIFKVDFEKVFYSVRWDYLDDILNNFGFGSKWRGLKQRDPLSPFLFILVMESLHLSFSNILNAGLFKGIRIDDSLSLSHLFYADDAVFIGISSSRSKSWDDVLAKISSRLSKWKNKTLSIGGRYSLTKSVLSSLPLYHMSIYKVPMGVLNNIESIRRRFFNGVDKYERKMSMIGWNKILASKKKGGFGVSSFFALNRALLLKWIWRFLSHGSSLWTRFIKVMYGDRGSLDNPGINLLKRMKKKVGNGVYTRFWEDPWLTDSPLMHTYPWLYSLECAKHATVVVKSNDNSLFDSFRRPPRGGIEEDQLLSLVDNVVPVILSNSNDRWVWSLDSSGEFSVKTARSYIDEFFLPTVGAPTRWVKVVPIKINIFAWKVSLDKLPSRLNLSLRGIDISSIICPICSSAGESCSHVLFSCNLARLIFRG